jgi:hypothetical protein
MAYDIEKTYSSFWGGISDDNSLWSENAVLDMVWIDVQTNERYATINSSFQTSLSITWTMTWVKETSIGAFRWNNSSTFNPSMSSISWLVPRSYAMESYWYGSNQYNYFFIDNTWNIGIVKTNSTGISQIGSTITTTRGIGDIVCGWDITRLAFAVGNTILTLNSTTDS